MSLTPRENVHLSLSISLTFNELPLKTFTIINVQGKVGAEWVKLGSLDCMNSLLRNG